MLILLLLSGKTYGQDSGSINLLAFKYGFHLPSGDMKDRFGSNNAIGISLEHTLIDPKLVFGLEGTFIFGSDVKEDVLANLRTADGSIIGINGRPGDINLKERGYYLGLFGGKIFSTSVHKNKLTGIRAQIGGGLLQHKIRVQDNGKSVVALEKKYLKGYDRLSNGPAIHLGLGYQYQSPTNNLHFHLMADVFAARTSSRRDIDYATGEFLDHKRTDILAGLSLAYIITISRVSKPEHIYY
jgi:hypothetical protein